MGAPRPVPTSQPTTLPTSEDATDQFAFTAVAASVRVLVRPHSSLARNSPSDNGNSDADQRLK